MIPVPGPGPGPVWTLLRSIQGRQHGKRCKRSPTPTLPGTAPARAYLVSAEQFVDVVAQEVKRPTHISPSVLDAVAAGGTAALGPGWYETIVGLDDIAQRRAFTFTCPWSIDDVDVSAPSAAYLALIASGLVDTFGWEAERVSAHLRSLRGVPSDA